MASYTAPGNMMSGSEIKVDPKDLYNQSTQVAQGKKTVQEAFSRMNGTMSASSSYWVGEAGDAFRETYLQFGDEIEEMLARLQEHVDDLNKMAGVYVETEKAVVETVSTLPDDVII